MVSGSRRTIRLTVDIEPATEPLQGVLRHPNGPDLPFAGWVALVRAVEIALDIERIQPESPPGR